MIEKQLECINNTISTINNYTNYLIETKSTYKEGCLLKELLLKIYNNGQLVGAKKLVNNGKTNQTILEYLNNMYCILYSFGLIKL